jgi:hypothetical protein
MTVLKISWPVCSITEYRPPVEFKKVWSDEYKHVEEIATRIGLRK